MNDPTRAELIEYIESVYTRELSEQFHTHDEVNADPDTHDGCACRFDIEEAAYYIAAHYHGGQYTNLYSALCCSPFKPGPCVHDLPVTRSATALYHAAAAWIGDISAVQN